MGNREIRQHPLGIPKAGDVFVFQSLIDLKTYRVPVDQFISSPITDDFIWTSGKAAAGDYAVGAIVEYGGNLWLSNVINNISVPGTNTEWTLLTRGKFGFNMWQPGVYLEDDVFVLYILESEVHIMRLTSIVRPYQTIDFATEYEAGDWVSVTQNKTIEFATFGSGTLNLDLYFLKERKFISNVIQENKTWTYTKTDNAIEFDYLFEIDGLYVQTLPPGTILAGSASALWNAATREWTPYDIGKYFLKVHRGGLEWLTTIEGPYT